MKKNNIVSNVLISFLLILFVGCIHTQSNHQRVISLENLKRIILDSNGIGSTVRIIKTYKSEKKCNFSEKYSNLYICKLYNSSDTVYVFEECEKVADFAFDLNNQNEIRIDTRKKIDNHPQKVVVFVPEDFTISKNSKYVFGSLIMVTDD